jgi:RNA polymerase sigma-70 factor (ECF subfamily)
MTRAREERETAAVDFSSLYRAHAADVRRFALYLSGDPALADDLVSDAFARVWTARERVELATVRAYLFAIVRNLFLKHRQREHRQSPLDERTPDEHPGPEDRARGHSELRAVVAALAGLPEPDRAAVLMRADEGLSYEEIGAALGISTGAAKVKVHRARLRLAEALESGPGARGRREQQR